MVLTRVLIVAVVLAVAATVALERRSWGGPDICAAGYAASVRPSYAVSHAIKLEMLHGRPARLYELDHIVPLELGGCPACRSNLQLQLWPDARRKDRAEDRLHALVCAGRMPLAEAQRRMREWKP